MNAVASADADYYRAFARADAAVKAGDCDAAIAVIEQALRKYPRDYALTLKLAWVEFQRGQYAAAERTYRAASTLSDGSVEARIGIGWSLIQEDRCDDARRVLHDVLSESDEESARRGLEACTERERVHGSVWAGLGGSLYQHHPWMHLSGDAYAGLDLVPIEGLELSAQYRFLDLEATDRRVPGFTQHEVYAQAGYTSKELDILGQGAVVWSGDAVVGGSRHVGASLRRKYFGALPGNVFVEVSGSYYADLWVVRLAPSWTVTFDPISLTAGVAIEQFAHDTLASASLTASLVLGSVSFWLNGKGGPEYRAAYLSQFGVFNAEDRSEWGFSGGARWRASEHWGLFVSYTLLRLRTSDGLLSDLHNLNVGTLFTL